jgi:thiamine pyrophosphate-dependent acetolactate synthase large subunit-like protein
MPTNDVDRSPARAAYPPPGSGPAEVEAPVGLTDRRPEARFASDRMLDELRRLGCKYLPTNPGSSFRGFHDSVVNYGGNRDPQLLLCHHEGIAVSMAHGYAKATRTTGFAVVHDLVGLMQGTMGVFNSYVDEVPMVLLGGGGPADTRERRPLDWVHSASAQAELIRNFIKWDAEPMDFVGTERAIAQAARIAATPPMGPTYVTLDCAVQEQSVEGVDAPAGREERGPSAGFAMPADVAEDIARTLLEAERPVIVVGPMGYDPAASRAVVRIAEAVGAACLDVDHAAVIPSEFAFNVTGDRSSIIEADVVLALGVRDLRQVVERVKGRRWGTSEGDPAEGARLIDVGLRDLWLRGWSDQGATTPECERRVSAEPVAAAATLASALEDLASARPELHGAREERRQAVRARHDELIESGLQTLRRRWDDDPIYAGRVVSELWDAVKDTPWVMTQRNTRSFPKGVWNFRDAGDYLGHSGGAGLGYGPGGTVGAALGAWETGRFPVAIIGDGDFLSAPGALWTAVHYKIPLLVVLNDNGSFYNDEDHQYAVAQDRERPVDNSWIGMRMHDPKVDVASLARGYGAWSSGPIEEPGALGGAIKDGVEAALGGAVAVVQVRTSPK